MVVNNKKKFQTTTALVGQGLLIIEASPSHSDTPRSVWLLWTSDQPDAETSTWQHTTPQETDIHAPGEIRTHNPSKRATALDGAATGVGLKRNTNDWYLES
jgi:hypothetical protein